MHIVVVDESQKRALSKSRKVLGAFLFRRGSRSYSGRLSQEGIESMIQSLKAVASKNTAVAIFSTGSDRGDLGLVARVGNARFWDDEGNYAFKTRERKIPPAHAVESRGDLWRAMRSMTRLAALFHDIGKANKQFQRKLRPASNPTQANSPSSEVVRHEMLSFLMLEAWARAQGADGAHWLDVLAQNPASLGSMRLANGSAALPSGIPGLGATVNWHHALAEHESCHKIAIDCGKALLERMESEPAGPRVALACVSWLVLTHHRPIDAAEESSSKNARKNPISLSPQLSQLNFPLKAHEASDAEPPSAELRAARAFCSDNLVLVDDALPWSRPAWLESVAQNAKTLLECLARPEVMTALAPWGADSDLAKLGDERQKQGAGPSLIPRARISVILAALARPSLILGDYIASIQKEAKAIDPVKAASMAFANTARQEGGASALADDLPTHLLKARRAVDPFFALASQSFELPAVDPAARPQLSFAAEDASRFGWQNKTCRALAAIDGIDSRPLFGVVVAETGSGKTIGGAKIMAAASGSALRYTCALGLRSLTLQTGKAYREALGFGSNECATMIGEPLYVKLSTKVARSDADPTPPTSPHASLGSESLDDYDGIEFDVPAGDKGSLAKILRVERKIAKQLFSPKITQLVETPIVACTVDHLISGSVLSHGRDAQPLLRLMTADLLLDEVDNYSIEDIKALCRLVQVAGLHRRRVLLMSATVGCEAVRALFNAWSEGVAASEALGATRKPALLLAHNREAPTVELFDAQNPLASGSSIEAFFAQVSRGSLAVKRLNFAAKISFDRSASLEERFQAMWNHALNMSQQHDVELPSGQRLSVGVVRFNKVQQARQFARWLHALDDPQGVSLRVLCYHSRFPMLMLSEIERQLNSLLKRSPDPVLEGQRLAEHELIRPWATQATLGQRLVAVVCSTSIQETGRDHDYDFAIVEPRSLRSVVQMSGRVRRHRPQSLDPVKGPNLAILSWEFAPPSRRDNHVGLELETIAAPSPGLFKIAPATEFGWTFGDFLTSSSQSFWTGIHQEAARLDQPGSTSIFRNLSPFPVMNGAGDRADMFPASFYQAPTTGGVFGVEASVCLGALPQSFALSPLASLERFAQRFHFEEIKPKFCNDSRAFPALLLYSPRAHPYKYPLEWLWSRHAKLVKFRGASQNQASFSFLPLSQDIDAKARQFGLYFTQVEADGRVCRMARSGPHDGTKVSDSYSVADHPERSLLDWPGCDDAKPLHENAADVMSWVEHELSARGLSLWAAHPQTPSAQAWLAMSFSAQQFGDDVPEIYFDMLLGADSCSSALNANP